MASPSFEGFAQEYLDWASGPNGKSSWRRDKTSLGHLCAFFGSSQLDRITQFDVLRYKHARENTVSEHTGQPIKGPTVNRELACLSRLFRLAAELEKVPLNFNPVRGVPRAQENKDSWTYLRDDDIRILLESCGTFFRPVVVAALATGMRAGELFALEWDDVDLVKGQIHIRTSKSGSPRRVPINGQLMAELNWLGARAESPLVFVTSRGASWKHNYRRTWRSTLEDAGLTTGIRFHDLRHTTGTHLMINGTHAFTAQEILGHKSLEMTRRYSHVDEEAKHAAVESLRWDSPDRTKNRITVAK